jgi:hypothetical protein
MLGTVSPSNLDTSNGRVSLPIATIRRGPNRPDRQRSIAAPERPFFRVSVDDVASVTYSFLQSDMSDPTGRGRDPGPCRSPGGLGGPASRVEARPAEDRVNPAGDRYCRCGEPTP